MKLFFDCNRYYRKQQISELITFVKSTLLQFFFSFPVTSFNVGRSQFPSCKYLMKAHLLK